VCRREPAHGACEPPVRRGEPALAAGEAAGEVTTDEHEQQQGDAERRQPDLAKRHEVGGVRSRRRHGDPGREAEQDEARDSHRRAERDVDDQRRREHLHDVEKEERTRRAAGRQHHDRDEQGITRPRPDEHGGDAFPPSNPPRGELVHRDAGCRGGDARGERRQGAGHPGAERNYEKHGDHHRPYAHRPAEPLRAHALPRPERGAPPAARDPAGGVPRFPSPRAERRHAHERTEHAGPAATRGWRYPYPVPRSVRRFRPGSFPDRDAVRTAAVTRAAPASLA
jgi:hypothetical protein